HSSGAGFSRSTRNPPVADAVVHAAEIVRPAARTRTRSCGLKLSPLITRFGGADETIASLGFPVAAAADATAIRSAAVAARPRMGPSMPMGPPARAAPSRSVGIVLLDLRQHGAIRTAAVCCCVEHTIGVLLARRERQAVDGNGRQLVSRRVPVGQALR